MGKNFDFRFISQQNALNGIRAFGPSGVNSLLKNLSETMEFIHHEGGNQPLSEPANDLINLACTIRILDLWSLNELYVKKSTFFDELSKFEVQKKYLEKLDIDKFFSHDLVEMRKLYLQKHPKNSEDSLYSYKPTKPNGLPVNIDASEINTNLIKMIEVFDNNGKNIGYLTDLTQKNLDEAIGGVESSAEMICLRDKKLSDTLKGMKKLFKFDVGVNLPVARNKITHGLSKALSTRNLNLN